MNQGDYQIDTTTVAGRNATGVYVDQQGAWLGEVVEEGDEKQVLPYRDDRGDFIPAPDHWQCLIVRRLR